ncbi:hypothetical protein EV426DRAFT_253793 [Tirmania nivea]|nr:hypothetical protein EV426DRAFT_253793 [Tirmania nivea]
MDNFQHDTRLKICFAEAEQVLVEDQQMIQKGKDDFVILTEAVGGVLIAGDGGHISEVDIEHHESLQLRTSAVVSGLKIHSLRAKTQLVIQPNETLEGNLDVDYQECDECVVFGDSGCVVTCPNHHNFNQPYATSVSSSPESTDSLGSSSPTFSNSGLSISNRCSVTPSIASSLGLGGGGKGNDKRKGKEREIVPVTVPEQVHRLRARFSEESTRSRDSSNFDAIGAVERKKVPRPILAFPPIYPQQVEGGPDEISVIPAPRTVLEVDSHPGRNGCKVVSFAFPDEGEVRRGERRLVVGSAASVELGRLEHVYRGNVYSSGPGYKWKMLVYLTILNPLICFLNALLTISFLALLTLTYPFKKISTNILPRPSQSPLPIATPDITDITTTTTANTPYTLSWNSYFSTHICNHLSSPLFFHLRIIYQTSRPPPSPDEWDAKRLVVVHLSAPTVSLVPCGLAAWGAMLMWVYSVLLGEGEEEGSGGWRRDRDVADDGGRRSGGEFYALRFVRKQWERWLWSALC